MIQPIECFYHVTTWFVTIPSKVVLFFGHVTMQKNKLMVDLRELDVIVDSRSLSVEEKGRRELTLLELDKLDGRN